jgi:hypothetical protein
MHAYDIGAKLMADGKVAPKELIPIFHRLIQQKSLEDVLVDVSDYSHVHHGPGVILVAHGAIYGMDEEDGRLGLLYRRRRDTGGSFDDRLTGVVRGLLVAARTLATQPELAPRLRFASRELEVTVQDRLHAPNTPETFTAVRPALERLASQVFAGATLTHVSDRRRRFTARLTLAAPLDLAAALARLPQAGTHARA